MKIAAGMVKRLAKLVEPKGGVKFSPMKCAEQVSHN